MKLFGPTCFLQSLTFCRCLFWERSWRLQKPPRQRLKTGWLSWSEGGGYVSIYEWHLEMFMSGILRCLWVSLLAPWDVYEFHYWHLEIFMSFIIGILRCLWVLYGVITIRLSVRWPCKPQQASKLLGPRKVQRLEVPRCFDLIPGVCVCYFLISEI